MPDGSQYVCLSPETGRPMFLERRPVPLKGNFAEACEHARDLDSHGRRDWKLPSPRELSAIFSLYAAIGGLDESAVGRDACYLTSYAPFETDVQVQSLHTGISTFIYTRQQASICFVRS